MKKRILIPYASYGTGHKAIGMYIKKYFEEQNKDFEILTLDLLEYSIPIIGAISKKVTEFIWRKFPWIWSFVYNIFDNKYGFGVTNKLSMAMFNNKKLKTTIKEFNPELTVSTHFFGSSLIANYNRKNLSNSKLVTVVTDYEAHEFWLKTHKSEDAIIVGDQDEIKALVKRGVDRHKIKPFGIPISPEIPSDFNREKSLKKYGFSGDRLVCLFFGGGGNGSKAVLPYIKRLIKDNLNIDILFISGKSKTVKEKVEKWVRYYNAKNIKVFGYVTNVPELFQICDFVVTKPGGAQSTEAIYFKKPALLINSVGGQEKANIKYLVKNGFGKKFGSTYTFGNYLNQINDNPNILDEMKKEMNENENDKAMQKLYELCVEILKK